MEPNKGPLLSQQEVGELPGVSVDTVRKWRQESGLPFVRLGYRTIRIRECDWLAFWEKLPKQGQP